MANEIKIGAKLELDAGEAKKAITGMKDDVKSMEVGPGLAKSLTSAGEKGTKSMSKEISEAQKQYRELAKQKKELEMDRFRLQRVEDVGKEDYQGQKQKPAHKRHFAADDQASAIEKSPRIKEDLKGFVGSARAAKRQELIGQYGSEIDAIQAKMSELQSSGAIEMPTIDTSSLTKELQKYSKVMDAIREVSFYASSDGNEIFDESFATNFAEMVQSFSITDFSSAEEAVEKFKSITGELAKAMSAAKKPLAQQIDLSKGMGIDSRISHDQIALVGDELDKGRFKSLSELQSKMAEVIKSPGQRMKLTSGTEEMPWEEAKQVISERIANAREGTMQTRHASEKAAEGYKEILDISSQVGKKAENASKGVTFEGGEFKFPEYSVLSKGITGGGKGRNAVTYDYDTMMGAIRDSNKKVHGREPRIKTDAFESFLKMLPADFAPAKKLLGRMQEEEFEPVKNRWGKIVNKKRNLGGFRNPYELIDEMNSVREQLLESDYVAKAPDSRKYLETPFDIKENLGWTSTGSEAKVDPSLIAPLRAFDPLPDYQLPGYVPTRQGESKRLADLAKSAKMTPEIVDEYLALVSKDFPEQLRGREDIVLQAGAHATDMGFGEKDYHGDERRNSVGARYMAQRNPEYAGLDKKYIKAVDFVRDKFGLGLADEFKVNDYAENNAESRNFSEAGKSIFRLVEEMYGIIQGRMPKTEGILDREKIVKGSSGASEWAKGFVTKVDIDSIANPEVSHSAKWTHAIRRRAEVAAQGKEYMLTTPEQFEEKRAFVARGNPHSYKANGVTKADSYSLDPRIAMNFGTSNNYFRKDAEDYIVEKGNLVASLMRPKDSIAWLCDKYDEFTSRGGTQQLNVENASRYTRYDYEKEFAFAPDAIQEALDTGFAHEFNLEGLPGKALEEFKGKFGDFSIEMHNLAQQVDDTQLLEAFQKKAAEFDAWLDDKRGENGYESADTIYSKEARRKKLIDEFNGLVPPLPGGGVDMPDNPFLKIGGAHIDEQISKVVSPYLSLMKLRDIKSIESQDERAKAYLDYRKIDEEDRKKITPIEADKRLAVEERNAIIESRRGRAAIEYPKEQLIPYVTFRNEHADEIYADDSRSNRTKYKTQPNERFLEAIEFMYGDGDFEEVAPQAPKDRDTAAKMLTEYYKRAKKEYIVGSVPKIGKKTTPEEIDMMRQQLVDRIKAKYKPEDAVLKAKSGAEVTGYETWKGLKEYAPGFFLDQFAKQVDSFQVQGVDPAETRRKIEEQNAAAAKAQRQAMIELADKNQQYAIDNNLFNAEGIGRQVFGNLFEGLSGKEVRAKRDAMSYDERESYDEKLMQAYEERGYGTKIGKVRSFESPTGYKDKKYYLDANGAILPESAEFLMSQIEYSRDDNLSKRLTGGKNQESFIPRVGDESFKTGTDVSSGYISGMQSKIGEVRSTGQEVGDAGLQGLADGAQSHSDSVFGIARGKDVGSGYAHGMLEMLSEVQSAGETVGMTALQAIQQMIEENGIEKAMQTLRDEASGMEDKGLNEGVSPAFAKGDDFESIIMKYVAARTSGEERKTFDNEPLMQAMSARYDKDFYGGMGYDRLKHQRWMDKMLKDPSLVMGGMFSFMHHGGMTPGEKGYAGPEMLTKPLALYRGLNGWAAVEKNVAAYSSDRAYNSQNPYFDYSPVPATGGAYAEGRYVSTDFDPAKLTDESRMLVTLGRPMDTLGMGSFIKKDDMAYEHAVYHNPAEENDEVRISKRNQRYLEERGYTYSFGVPNEDAYNEVVLFGDTIAQVAQKIGMYNEFMTSVIQLLGDSVVADLNNKYGENENNKKVVPGEGTRIFTDEELKANASDPGKREDYESQYPIEWTAESNKRIFERGLWNKKRKMARHVNAEDLPTDAQGKRYIDNIKGNDGNPLQGEELTKYLDAQVYKYTPVYQYDPFKSGSEGIATFKNLLAKRGGFDAFNFDVTHYKDFFEQESYKKIKDPMEASNVAQEYRSGVSMLGGLYRLISLDAGVENMGKLDKKELYDNAERYKEAFGAKADPKDVVRQANARIANENGAQIVDDATIAQLDLAKQKLIEIAEIKAKMASAGFVIEEQSSEEEAMQNLQKLGLMEDYAKLDAADSELASIISKNAIMTGGLGEMSTDNFISAYSDSINKGMLAAGGKGNFNGKAVGELLQAKELFKQGDVQGAMSLMQQNGQYMGEGVLKGLEEADPSADSASFVSAIDKAIRKAAGIASPAAAFKPIGFYMALGIMEGMKETDLAGMIGQIILQAINQAMNNESTFNLEQLKNSTVFKQAKTDGKEFKENTKEDKIAKENADQMVRGAIAAGQKADEEERAADAQTRSTQQSEREAKNDNDSADASERKANLQRPRTMPAYGGMGDMYSQAGQLQMQLRGIAQQWLGIGAAIRMARQAISSVKKTITELDKSITAIATVTNLSSSDLWNQIPQYTAMAKEFGVAINDVYKTSLLYYQQGMATNQVTEMTNQTLKLSKIAGLDAAKASDYMTNAFRAFKMEMSDAGQIADTYAALASNAATSVSEIAEAMTKASAGANAVGISFKNTSAFITMMIETTRESASVIGSALSSMTARYSKLQQNPNESVKEDGDTMSVNLNDVDKALASVGINMQDSTGQIRDMEEVVVELAAIWDTLDRNTQSYVATLMAGARMKSKFQAMVGDYARLSELQETAENSENTAQLQLLKNMDSIETKTQQLQTAMQSLYTNVGLENLAKWWIDFKTSIVETLNSLGSGQAIAQIAAIFTNISTLGINAIQLIMTRMRSSSVSEGSNLISAYKNAFAQIEAEKAAHAQRMVEIAQNGAGQEGAFVASQGSKQALKKAGRNIGITMGISTLGSLMSTSAMSLKEDTNADRGLKAGLTGAGGILSGIGTGLMIGGVPGAIIGSLTAIPSIISAIGIAVETTQEKIEKLQAKAKESKNVYLVAQGEADNIETTIKKLKKLEDARYDSDEAMKEYLDYCQTVASSYPELVSAYDAEGNAIINTADAYDLLSIAAEKAAKAKKQAAQDGLDVAVAQKKVYDSNKELLGERDTTLTDEERLEYTSYFMTGTDEEMQKYYHGIDEGHNILVKDLSSGKNGNINDYDTRAVERYYQILYNAFDSNDATKSQAEALKKAKEDGLTFDELVNFTNQFNSFGETINGELTSQTDELIDAQIALTSNNWTKINGDYLTQAISTGNKNIQGLIKAKIDSMYKEDNINGSLDKNDWYNTEEAQEKISELINKINSFYADDLNLIQQEDLLKTLGNLNNYSSADELEKYLGNELGIEDPEIIGYIKDYYISTTQTSKALFKKSIESFKEDGRFTDLDILKEGDFTTGFGETVVKKINEAQKLIDKGLVTYGTNLGNAWIQLAINASGDSGLQSILMNAELDTFEGIKEAQKKVEEGIKNGTVDAGIAAKIDLASLTAEVQVNATTFLNSIATDFSEASKTLSDLNETVSFDKAAENFKTLQSYDYFKDKSFGEVYRINEEGKLELTAEALIEAEKAVFEDFRTRTKQEKDVLDNRITELGRINFNSVNEEDFKNIKNGEKVEVFTDVSDSTLDWLQNIASMSATKEEFIKNVEEALIQEGKDAEQAESIIQAASDSFDKTKTYNAFKEIDISSIISPESLEKYLEQKSKLETFFTEAGIANDEITETVNNALDGFFTGDLTKINKTLLDKMSIEQKQSVIDAPLTNATKAFETLQKGTGQVLSDGMIAAIITAGIKLEEIAEKDGSGEWITKKDIDSSVYTDALKRYIKTTSDNIKSVNEQLIKIMDTELVDEKAMLAFAKSASSGTLQLSDIESVATEMGMKVDDFIERFKDNYLSQQFDGSYKVKNFGGLMSKVANSIGTYISETAEWYVEQLSASADSAITERTKNGKKGMEQLKALSTAKVGDKINLAYLQNAFDLTEEQLRQMLAAYGIYYKNGIGKLTKNFTPKRFKELINVASVYAQNDIGAEGIAESMSMLEDAVESAFKNWADLISNGLSGSLTNENAETLRANFGLTEDMFTRTPTGLKMSEEAIANMYVQIKEVDSVAAQMTLEKIVADSKNLGDGIRSASDIMQTMEDTGKELAAVEKEILEISSKIESAGPADDVASEKKRLEILLQQEKSLKNQLQLYGSMRANALDNPDMWKMSDNELSNPVQANLNAWKSAGDWMDALKNGKSKNILGVQDFTNMIEFVAQNVEGAAENFLNSGMTAEEVIRKGYEHLKNVDGNTVVDLGKIGINFMSGSESMGENVTKGINNLAQSQVDMLDALIAMLEVIVAMEELKGIDNNGNDEIDLSEIFPEITAEQESSKMGEVIEEINDFDEDFERIRSKIFDKAKENEDLRKALEGLHPLGKDISVADMFGFNFDTGELEKASEVTKKLNEAEVTYGEYKNTLNAFLKAALSDGYDTNNLIQSVMEQLGEYGSKKPIYYEEGEKVISLINGTTYSIDFDDKATWKNIEAAMKKVNLTTNKKNKDDVENAIKNYLMSGNLSDDKDMNFVIGTSLGDIKIEKEIVDGKEEEIYKFKGVGFKTPQEAAEAYARYTSTQNLGNGGEITVEYDKETGTIKIKQTWGVETEVELGDDGVYHGKDGNTYTDYDDFVKQSMGNDYEAYENAQKEGNKELQYQLKTEHNIEEKDKVHYNLNTSDRDRNNVGKEILSMSQKQLDEAWDKTNGVLNLPSGKTLEVNTDNIEDIIEFGESLAGIDTGLVNSISTAIGEAFANPAVGAQIGTAIRDGIANAFLQTGETTEGTEPPTIDLSKITIKIGESGVQLENADDVKKQIHDQLQELLQSGIDPIEIPIEIIIGDITPAGVNGGNEGSGFLGGQNTTPGTQSPTETTTTTSDLKDAVFNVKNATVNSKKDDKGSSGGNKNDGKVEGGEEDPKKTKTQTFETKASSIAPTAGNTTAGIDISQEVATAKTQVSTLATNIGTTLSGVDASGAAKKITEAVNNVNIKVKEPDTVIIKVKKPDTIELKAKATITVTVNGDATATAKIDNTTGAGAKGNVALAKGTAMSGGSKSTLMGELGPELVVSNGSYYTVGNTGAEFVDLPNDAIVFNHLQTKSLLNKNSTGRGKPIKSEKAAVSFAKGNLSGPAMSSASSALAALKQLRAMWASLAGASAKDLGGAPSGGGGGGGGGNDLKAFTKELMYWYNTEKQIERLEKQITLYEKQRANYISAANKDGYKYAASLSASKKAIESELSKQKELNALVKRYQKQRMNDFNSSKNGMSKILKVNADGSVNYTGKGFSLNAALQAKDKNGKAILNSDQQYKLLSDWAKKNMGSAATSFLNGLNYSADGTKAKNSEDKVKNFYDLIDGEIAEMESYNEKIDSSNEKIEELQSSLNEIEKEIKQQRIDLEQKVMTAYTDKIQAEIDALKDYSDAVKKAGEDYVDGLNKSLEKEKSMYDKQKSESDLVKLQRQLAILQRTGGSASEISSLQNQINSQLKENYFQAQQDQIDSVKSALDEQTNALEKQVELQTEALEYNKKNGLYWEEVLRMINTWSPEKLSDYVLANTTENKEKSSDELENVNNENELLAQEVASNSTEISNAAAKWRTGKAGGKNISSYSESSQQAGAAKFSETMAKLRDNDSMTDAEKIAQATTDANNVLIQTAKEEEAKQNATVNASTDVTDPVKSAKYSEYTGYVNALKWGKNNLPYYVPSKKITKTYKKASGKEKQKKTLKKGTWYKITAASGNRIKLGKNGWIEDKKKAAAYKELFKLTNGKSMNKKTLLSKINKFKTGGVVDYTGPAWLDGTKNRPEAVLSASDYELLKSKIFDNSGNSLKNAVDSITSLLEMASNASEGIASGDSGITFENVSLTIESGTISNDYDAKRAGQNIMDEMMKIARKSGNISITRR